MDPFIQERRDIVRDIVREAGLLALDYFQRRHELVISLKGRQDWLTEADGAVETFLRQKIGQAFPNDQIVGEEQGGTGGDAMWIADPIDGTANFARGDRQWCVSLGFARHGVPEIGFIFAPAQDEFYEAVRGAGATMNDQPIRVAPTHDIRHAVIELGWSPRRPTGDYLALIGRTMEAGATVKRSASGALGMAHVANSRTDGYGEVHINSWDVLAGLVIAREAGALINDFCSGPWVTEGNPILCVTPGIAKDLEKVFEPRVELQT
ncbi:MAG: inositol monophosphatase [Beijerinckiaceae bacterium]|nr:inositol monophosphatase [Beijerinckiaceae bacterium]